MSIWGKCKQMLGGRSGEPQPEFVQVLTYAPLGLQATRNDQLLGYEVPAVRQSLNSFLYTGYYQSNQIPSPDIWPYEVNLQSTFAPLPYYRSPSGNIMQVPRIPWAGGQDQAVIIDVQ